MIPVLEEGELMKRFVAALAVVLSLTSLAAADPPAVLEVTGSVGLSCYRGKDTTSNGQGVTSPIRQNQNWRGFASRVLLLNFDARPIQGWTISKAYLHLYVAKGDLYGVGLTEVLAPWGQPRTSNFTTETGGPCWRFAHTPKDGAPPAVADWWAWPGSSFPSVSWAHPSARYQFIGPAQIERTRVGVPATEPAPPGKDRFTHLKLPIDPDLVAALAAGTNHGLVLTDDKGQVAEAYSLIGPGYPYKDNDAEDPCVFIKAVQEPSLRPRLEVYGAKSDAAAPSPPKDVKVARSEAGSGTVYLEFVAPGESKSGGNLLAYEVSYRTTTQPDWTPLPRWSMPRPAAAGSRQVMPVWTLPPGQYELSIRSVDKSGNRSDPAIVPLTVPARPDVKLAAPAAKDPFTLKTKKAEAFTLAAVPDLAKVDPASGAVLYAGDRYRLDAAYLQSNSVFTGQAVTLTAAANEVVAFQLIVAKKVGKLAGLKVEVADLVGLGLGGKKIAAKPNAQTFRVWYVRSLDKPRRSMGPGETEDLTVRPVAWHGDACLPLTQPFDEAFDLPAADNGIPDQTNQAVWIDLFVPKETPAGCYCGNVIVTGGEPAETATLPVELEVLPLALPDKPSWRVELNCYGGLADFAGVAGKDAKASTEAEYTFYRLAKAHRQMINALPYHQNGSVDETRTPAVAGEGAQVKVSDWSAWDNRLGPLLDGSAFTAEKGYTGPGAGTPISHIYLPFNENWPLPLEKYYGDFARLNDRLDFAEWARKSRPLAEAFDKDYQAGVSSAARQFAEHFKEKGWTGTEFQFFLNNKYYYKLPFFSDFGSHGSSFWLLDEPVDHDDYAADAFFLGLARRGVESAKIPDIKFAFRVDNSMPDMARGLLDNVCDLEMLGWGAIYSGPTAAIRQKFIPTERFWHYGGAVSTSGPPVGLLGNFLAGWCSGSDGILPYWTTLRGADWGQADDMAIFYTGRHYANGHKNYPGALPGLRMKVMRRCQQDIEYLQLLSAAKGWGRDVVRQAVAAYADDPAAPVLMFKKLTPDQADQLRATVARTLMEMK